MPWPNETMEESLAKKVETLETQRNKLRVDLDAAHGAEDVLRDRNAELRKENERLIKKAAALSVENQQLAAAPITLDGALMEERDALREERDDLRGQNERLRGKVEELREGLRRLSSKRRDWQEEHRAMLQHRADVLAEMQKQTRLLEGISARMLGGRRPTCFG
jgi:uncharacterized coiled-coil DUF342 family protein